MKQETQQVAFLGSIDDLARLVAAATLPHLQGIAAGEQALDVAGAAALMQLSEGHVRKLAEEGKIPCWDANPLGEKRIWRFWKHKILEI